MIEQNIKAQACAYAHALSQTLVTIEELMSWLNTLMTDCVPIPDYLVELTRNRTKPVEEIINLLWQVSGGTVAELWWPLFKQQAVRALENQKIQPQAIANYCYNLALNGDVPAYDCEALYQIELEYDCIITGYGTQEEVDAEVVRFLSKTLD